MYLQYQASKKDTNRTQIIIFYSSCALYVLSVAVFVCNKADAISTLLREPQDSLISPSFIQTTSFSYCDFLAQFILIYRCWIVWGCNIRVVIIPTLLAFAFLGIWLASGDSACILLHQLEIPHWRYLMAPTSLALSLTVNALVTGLIMFRIFKVFREVKATSDDQTITTGGSRLRRTILVLIESGMALFSIQLARFVVTTVWTEAAINAFYIICNIHKMLIGITPTIILVRTSMGLSFRDEKSMEVKLQQPKFAVPETGSINIVGKDSNDNIGVERGNDQQSNDINIVQR